MNQSYARHNYPRFCAALDTAIPTKEHKSELHLGKFTKQERKEHAALRRKHITITKRELGCGHRFSVGQVPHNNCDACWLTHFRTIPGIRWTDSAGAPYDGVSPELIAEVTATRGAKYAKRLRWYLAVNAALHMVRPELAAK